MAILSLAPCGCGDVLRICLGAPGRGAGSQQGPVTSALFCRHPRGSPSP